MPATVSTLHHHVILTPRPDQVDATRELLLECARQVSLKKDENGPSSWWASFDEEKGAFLVEALFANQEAVQFHQGNIGPIVKRFGALMAAPPETVVRAVFVSTTSR